MAERENQTCYEIVTFKDTLDPTGKPVGDLVPSLWVQKFGDGYVCFYPPAPYKNVPHLVKNQTKPSSSWQKFNIERHGTADTYKKGCERFERFLRKLSVDTTENENEQMTKHKASVLSNLNDVPKFPDNSPPFTLESGEDSRKDVQYPNSSASSDISPGQSIVKEIPNKKKKRKHCKRSIINSDGSDSNESDSLSQPRKLSKYTTDPHQRYSCEKAKQNACTSTKNMGSIKHSSHKRVVVSDSEYETPKKTQTIHRLNTESRSKVAEVSRGDLFNTTKNKPVLQNELTGESEIMRLKTEVSDMKRSIVHEIRKLRTTVNECLSTFQNFMRKQGGELEVGKIADFEACAQLSFPCKDEDEFTLFNNFLKEKENFDKFMQVLRDLWVTPNEKWTINKSVTIILQRYLSKELAKEYSAKGKSKLKKKDFSSTLVFKALEGALVSAEAKINVNDLTSAIGIALANARDWEGGRLERGKKNA